MAIEAPGRACSAWAIDDIAHAGLPRSTQRMPLPRELQYRLILPMPTLISRHLPARGPDFSESGFMIYLWRRDMPAEGFDVASAWLIFARREISPA